jgi:hypothetical protein
VGDRAAGFGADARGELNRLLLVEAQPIEIHGRAAATKVDDARRDEIVSELSARAFPSEKVAARRTIPSLFEPLLP